MLCLPGGERSNAGCRATISVSIITPDAEGTAMSDKNRCPRCQSTVEAGADACPECGLAPQRKLLQFGLVVVAAGGLALYRSVLAGSVLVVLGTGVAVASQLGPTVWM